jgi:hypothetical protein
MASQCSFDETAPSTTSSSSPFSTPWVATQAEFSQLRQVRVDEFTKNNDELHELLHEVVKRKEDPGLELVITFIKVDPTVLPPKDSFMFDNRNSAADAYVTLALLFSGRATVDSEQVRDIFKGLQFSKDGQPLIGVRVNGQRTAAVFYGISDIAASALAKFYDLPKGTAFWVQHCHGQLTVPHKTHLRGSEFLNALASAWVSMEGMLMQTTDGLRRLSVTQKFAWYNGSPENCKNLIHSFQTMECNQRDKNKNFRNTTPGAHTANFSPSASSASTPQK